MNAAGKRTIGLDVNGNMLFVAIVLNAQVSDLTSGANAPTPEQPANAAAMTPCCEHPHTATQTVCFICDNSTCRKCRGLVNGLHSICRDCKKQVLQELRDERPRWWNTLLGSVCGLAAGIAAGALWSEVESRFKLDGEYLWTGVGYVAGYGVFLGSGQKRGLFLQNIAIFATLLGVIVTQVWPLLLAAFYLNMQEVQDIAVQFSLILPILFAFDPWRWFWLMAALYVAGRVVRPTKLRLM
jgi:hypothetical protein